MVGWLNMLSIIMPGDEWKDFRTWHNGVFARLHDPLRFVTTQFGTIKSPSPAEPAKKFMRPLFVHLEVVDLIVLADISLRLRLLDLQQ